MSHAVTEQQIRRIYQETIDAFYANVSRRCGGDRDFAEDVVQEAWLRAVRDWRSNGVPEKPIGWLTTVARNLLFNEFRKRRPVRLESITAEEILTAMGNGEASDSAEIAVLVGQALARLPDTQSELLEAFHFDRCRTSQIAESLGISERAVEGRLRRARENLRAELKQYFARGALI
jgi:RNA polymerase sigma-70 factor (ECF subfamily)